jgi:hypothetical protein
VLSTDPKSRFTEIPSIGWIIGLLDLVFWEGLSGNCILIPQSQAQALRKMPKLISNHIAPAFERMQDHPCVF